MLLNDKALSLAEVASKEVTRYALTGLLIDNGKVVASDGKRIVIGNFPTPDENDFPETPEVKDGCDFQVILPADAAKGLRKKLMKKSTLPILQYAKVNIEKKDNYKMIKAATTNLEVTSVDQIREVEGVFPDYEKIMVQEKPVKELVIDPDLFADTLRHFTLSKKFKAVKLSFYEKEGSPVKLYAFNEEVGEVSGLIMPLSIEMETMDEFKARTKKLAEELQAQDEENKTEDPSETEVTPEQEADIKADEQAAPQSPEPVAEAPKPAEPKPEPKPKAKMMSEEEIAMLPPELQEAIRKEMGGQQ